MNGSDHVHQIECRWRPQLGFSPVATSLPTNTEVTDWFARVRDAIWPQPTNQTAGVPETSVAYLTFLDNTAVVIWRHWDINAIPIKDGSSRRPLVARVLAGPRRLLTPQAAISIGLAGVTAITDSQPGRVEPGATLSPVSADQLSELTRNTASALDGNACQDPGLRTMIAAALQYHDRFLAIELPAAETCDPASAAQIRLLWGLWRTTAPLLADLDATQVRGWSFSTYEPGWDSDRSPVQAEIVFRTIQSSGPPLVVADEVTVTPREPAPADDAYADLADRLVMAFQYLGGTELTKHLTDLCKDSSSRDDRLTVIDHYLRNQATPPTGPILPTSQGIPSAAGANFDADELVLAGPRAQANSEPPDAGAEAGWPPTDSPSLAPAQAGQSHGDPGNPTPAYVAERGGVTEVLDWLAAGPGTRDFRRAIGALHDATPLSWPEDRAAARRSMVSRQWYVPVLVRENPWRLEETLQAIFSQVVVPDLNLETVCAEVADWAIDPQTPAVAIKSLVAAAQQADHSKAVNLHSALEPVMYRRWLAEHGLYLPLRPAGRSESNASSTAALEAKQTPRPVRDKHTRQGNVRQNATRPAVARHSARPDSVRYASDSSHSEPPWSRPRPLLGSMVWNFPVNERTALVASTLVWVCLILAIVVVLVATL